MPKTLTRLDPLALLAHMADGVDSDETDDRILRVAARAIATDGPSGFEVDDVAAEAGVGRSTVYRRYGDRNGLLVAALAHEGRRLLDALAEATAPIDDMAEEIVAAFCAGIRFAQAAGLGDLARRDDLVLRLLTVDSGPLVAAASDHLASLAVRRDTTIGTTDARRSAEVLIRLAISFVLAPTTSLSSDGIEDIDEDAIRRHVVAAVAGGRQSASRVVAAPTS